MAYNPQNWTNLRPQQTILNPHFGDRILYLDIKYCHFNISTKYYLKFSYQKVRDWKWIVWDDNLIIVSSSFFFPRHETIALFLWHTMITIHICHFELSQIWTYDWSNTSTNHKPGKWHHPHSISLDDRTIQSKTITDCQMWPIRNPRSQYGGVHYLSLSLCSSTTEETQQCQKIFWTIEPFYWHLR